MNPWIFGVQLLDLFRRSGHLADLQQAITVLEVSIRSIPSRDHWYIGGLTNFGISLSYRFDRLGEPSEEANLGGFEQFLLHKEFSQLRASAHSGPVVILNAAETRCDALIVLANVDHVIHVTLPNFTLQRAMDLQTSFGRHTRDGRSQFHSSAGQGSTDFVRSPH